MKMRKKPIVVEAKRFYGENGNEIVNWISANDGTATYHVKDGTPIILVSTLEGTMICAQGWWIIQGVHGEFYPCAPDVMEASYDPEGEVSVDRSTIVGVIEPETDAELADKVLGPLDTEHYGDLSREANQ